MAGFMIENILDGLVDQVTWDEALELAAEDGEDHLRRARTPIDAPIPRDHTIAHTPGSLLLLPVLPLASALFDCINCRTHRLDRVDDSARRIGGPLDRSGLHE